jgi:hypothetical protein
MSILFAPIELTHLFGVLKVSAASATVSAAMAMTVEVPSSSLGGEEHPLKKACTVAFLPLSSRYMSMWSSASYVACRSYLRS